MEKTAEGRKEARTGGNPMAAPPPGGEVLHSLHSFRCKRENNPFRINKPMGEFGNQSVT